MCKKIIITNELFPIVPLINYSKIPIFPWSKSEYHIKDNNELLQIGNTYKKDVEGKERGGLITGYSLLTGGKSGVMVIDIDKNHGDSSVNGIQNFEEFLEDLSDDDKRIVTETFSVRTPRGGLHLYFKYKKGLKNKANYIQGVDIRTDGGLIVLPNSRVKNGEVNDPYKVVNDNKILDMPESLYIKFLKLDQTKNTITASYHNDVKKYTTNKYYKKIEQGGRDSTLVSWLGYVIKQNPSMRNKENLLPYAHMYNTCYFLPPLEESEVEKKVESALKYSLPEYCDDKGRIDNWRLVNHVLSTSPSYNKGNLYCLYDYEKGYYKHMDYRQVQTMYFKYPIDDREKTANKAKSFSDLLMLVSENAGEVYDEKKYINCLNGIIDIENDKLIPHDSKYKLEVQFKANYIEDWKERFDKSIFKVYLNSTLDEGSIITLQESWGLMLSPHAKEVQNCFIYKGEGSNGKSLAFEIQESLIGSNDNICSIGLGDFGGEFVISSAEGKHVNIVRDDELTNKKVNKSFKSMCCGEPVQVNRKNKDIIRLGFNMTMFFGLNKMPESDDNSVGFFRRPIIIPFKNSFGTAEEVKKGIRDKVKDPEMAKKIIENELDIVLMWAYEGLKRVRNNKWKVSISRASLEEHEEYRRESDSAYAFYKERIIKVSGEGVKLVKRDLFNIYTKWCYDNGLKALDISQFGRQLSKFGIKSKASNGTRYWIDIKVN